MSSLLLFGAVVVFTALARAQFVQPNLGFEQAPGYAALPPCAAQVAGVVVSGSYPNCQSADPSVTYIGCLCSKDYDVMTNSVALLLTSYLGGYYNCGTEEVSSAQTVISNFCVKNEVALTGPQSSTTTRGFGSAPASTTVPGQNQAFTTTPSTATATAGASSSSSGDSGGTSGGSGGISSSDRIAIGVGVGIGVPGLIATVVGIILANRRSKHNKEDLPNVAPPYDGYNSSHNYDLPYNMQSNNYAVR